MTLNLKVPDATKEVVINVGDKSKTLLVKTDDATQFDVIQAINEAKKIELSLEEIYSEQNVTSPETDAENIERLKEAYRNVSDTLFGEGVFNELYDFVGRRVSFVKDIIFTVRDDILNDSVIRRNPRYNKTKKKK